MSEEEVSSEEIQVKHFLELVQPRIEEKEKVAWKSTKKRLREELEKVKEGKDDYKRRIIVTVPQETVSFVKVKTACLGFHVEEFGMADDGKGEQVIIVW